MGPQIGLFYWPLTPRSVLTLWKPNGGFTDVKKKKNDAILAFYTYTLSINAKPFCIRRAINLVFSHWN